VVKDLRVRFQISAYAISEKVERLKSRRGHLYDQQGETVHKSYKFKAPCMCRARDGERLDDQKVVVLGMKEVDYVQMLGQGLAIAVAVCDANAIANQIGLFPIVFVQGIGSPSASEASHSLRVGHIRQSWIEAAQRPFEEGGKSDLVFGALANIANSFNVAEMGV